MKTKKVLLAGATGYLGRYVASHLLEKGYDTRLIVRNAQKAQFNSDSFEIFEAQVTQPATLKGVCEDIDTVISTIGITKQKDGLTYMSVDFLANMNLLEEAKKNGVRKFIYVSALNGEKLNRLKIALAKELFVDELKKSGLVYCIIRPNGFFSDTTEFLKMAKKGTVNLFGDGSYKMNPIHGEDLAAVCVDAIASNAVKIEVGGPEVLTHNEIAKLAFKTLDKKPRIKYMPGWLRKLVIWMMRTFTSSKTYGPIEFFMTVLAMDMIAPTFGKHTLKDYFEEVHQNMNDEKGIKH
nr:SDR family oxidoreductase [Bacteroidota bacterium]